MTRRPPRVVTNVLWNWTNYGLNIAVAFYITPLLIERLGDTSYGLWILLSSILGYYGLLNFGIDSALVHYISKYLADDRREDIGKVIGTGRMVFGIIAIAVVLLSIGIGAAFVYSDFVFRHVFQLSEELRRPFAILLVVLSLGMVASFLSRVSVSILRARERFDLLNVIQITMLIGRTLAIVFLMGNSLLALGYIFAVSGVLIGLATWLAARKISPVAAEECQPGFDMHSFRTMRKFGVFSFLNWLADHVRFYTDALVIGHFMRMQFITYFNLATIIITYFRHFIGHAASPFFPVFSRYHGAKDEEALRRTFLRASKVLAFLAVLAAGNIMGSAYPFLNLWVGDIVAAQYVTLSYRVLLVLLLPFTIEMIQSVAVNAIYGMGQHHRLTTLRGLEGAANLVLSIVLVQYLGLLGVALGTAIPLVVTQLFFVSRIVCRLTGIDTLRYVARHIVVPVCFGFLLGVGQTAIYRSTAGESYWILVAVTAATSLLLAIPMFLAYFSKDDRRLFWELWSSWRGAEQR
jgi:O-antigen/teichoic acid export membrane protein